MVNNMRILYKQLNNSNILYIIFARYGENCSISVKIVHNNPLSVKFNKSGAVIVTRGFHSDHY